MEKEHTQIQMDRIIKGNGKIVKFMDVAHIIILKKTVYMKV